MSQVIQGSKSLTYNKLDIPGKENTGDVMQHLSVQEVSGKRGAIDAVIHGSTTVSAGHAVETGSAQRQIKSTAHGASVGWIMRPSTGNSTKQEIPIVGIIDADTFAISAIFDIAIGDLFDLCKFVTPNYSADGDLNVIATQGPSQFVLNGVDTETQEDTSVPANNHPFPSKLFYEKNGVNVPVRLDTVTPANNNEVPVVIAGPIPLPTGSATAANQTLEINAITANGVLLGTVTETAPATDTASSGLNGRLQRIAQRLTSLIALFPTSLGQKTMANSFAVTLASDQSSIPVAPGALTPTFQEITNLTTSAQTFTAPAGAKWMKISAGGQNTDSVRFKLGGTATITSGIRLEPSRTEDLAVAGNVSVIAETGTSVYVCVIFGA